MSDRPQPPIINARREIPLLRRLVSDAATLALWGGWILLWLPAFHTLRRALRRNLDWQDTAERVAETITPISLDTSALLVLGTAGLLLLWTLVPNRKPDEVPQTETLEDEARRLKVPSAELQAGRESRICVVEHDDEGVIRGIRLVDRPGDLKSADG